jgi:hypothetical protein
MTRIRIQGGNHLGVILLVRIAFFSDSQGQSRTTNPCFALALTLSLRHSVSFRVVPWPHLLAARVRGAADHLAKRDGYVVATKTALALDSLDSLGCSMVDRGASPGRGIFRVGPWDPGEWTEPLDAP